MGSVNSDKNLAPVSFWCVLLVVFNFSNKGTIIVDDQVLFGNRKPAFSVSRFKRTLPVMLNEEMAQELIAVLESNEKIVKDYGGSVAAHLLEFKRQLHKALHVPAPVHGTKTASLTPSKRSPRYRAVS